MRISRQDTLIDRERFTQETTTTIFRVGEPETTRTTKVRAMGTEGTQAILFGTQFDQTIFGVSSD